jgi:hypothetical protein
MSGIERVGDRRISSSLDGFAGHLMEFLEWTGLPSDLVLVEVSQRKHAIDNIPNVLDQLSPVQRQGAMYVSKFVAACAVGLFDAALNYIWDETIRNLRSKVARFDLEYFYDTAIPDPRRRPDFVTEDHLVDLADWVLIKGCQQTGIISDIGYKHLDFIREMRNHASAAHPNQNQLTGLQLVAWLETCIKEVLSKEPEGPTIVVGRLLQGLRRERLQQQDIPPIATAIAALPAELSASLLRTLFGMYTDDRIASEVRDNLRLVIGTVWSVCSDDARFEVGLKYGNLKANAQLSRAGLAREFLEYVGGLPFLSEDTLAVELSSAIRALLDAHEAWYNFYNEPAPARALQALVPKSGMVPASVRGTYVKALAMCRMGNSYGVSREAVPIYDELIGRWTDAELTVFVKLLLDPDVRSRLQFPSCSSRFGQLIARLAGRATSVRVKAALDALQAYPGDIAMAAKDVTLRPTFEALAAT